MTEPEAPAYVLVILPAQDIRLRHRRSDPR